MSYLLDFAYESATVTDLGYAQNSSVNLNTVKLGNQSVENIWSQKTDMTGSFLQLIITQHTWIPGESQEKKKKKTHMATICYPLNDIKCSKVVSKVLLNADIM